MAVKKKARKVLVVDVGGSNIKILMTGIEERIKIPSDVKMSAQEMVDKVIAATKEANWKNYFGKLDEGTRLFDLMRVGWKLPLLYCNYLG